MAQFVPIDITQQASKAIDQVKADLPFDSNSWENQIQQLNQTASNVVASEINDLAGGARTLANQYAPFPAKKLVTFYLLDAQGKLAQTDGSSFQPGYLFNMTVNPSQFNITYPPKTIVPVRTMGGWVLQHWYPDIGTISANGIIGNLLQQYNTDVKKTPNWAGFMKLLTVYQNNGVPYAMNKGQRGTRSFNPVVVCVYDGNTYHGYFENLIFEENQEQPYTRNYTFNYRFVNMLQTQDIVSLTRDKITGVINNNSVTKPLTGAINSLVGQNPF